MSKKLYRSFSTPNKIGAYPVRVTIEIIEDDAASMLARIYSNAYTPEDLFEKYPAVVSGHIRDCYAQIVVELTVSDPVMDRIDGKERRQEKFTHVVTRSVNPDLNRHEKPFEDVVRERCDLALAECAERLCLRYNIINWDYYKITKTTAIRHIKDIE